MPKVLAVDLDGTLFYPKRPRTLISFANIKFLRDFIDAGNRVIIVTSRNCDFVAKTAAKIDRKIDYVCINGAQIIIDGKLIFNESLPVGRSFEIFQDMKDHFDQPLAWFLDSDKYQNLVYDNGNGWFVLQFFKYYYKAQGVYQQDYLADNDKFMDELKHGNIYRMLLYFGLGKRRMNIAKEVNRHMRVAYPDIVEASWINNVVEIAPRNCHKAAALERIIVHEGINREDVYVVGDSGNDISMFQAFHDHSFCMDHAHDAVKKFAAHTIKRVHDLRKILLNEEVNHD
ncbi:MAG TPA: hypothetical protein DCX17_00965 [Firmicutes bacterium]|nr:hypothetical protein [Bacillota bacterium]